MKLERCCFFSPESLMCLCDGRIFARLHRILVYVCPSDLVNIHVLDSIPVMVCFRVRHHSGNLPARTLCRSDRARYGILRWLTDFPGLFMTDDSESPTFATWLENSSRPLHPRLQTPSHSLPTSPVISGAPGLPWAHLSPYRCGIDSFRSYNRLVHMSDRLQVYLGRTKNRCVVGSGIGRAQRLAGFVHDSMSESILRCDWRSGRLKCRRPNISK